MASLKDWLEGITIVRVIVAVMGLWAFTFIASMGYKFISPDARVTAIDVRLTTLETRVGTLEKVSNEQTVMMANLNRVACLNNATTAFTAGIDCRSLFRAPMKDLR